MKCAGNSQNNRRDKSSLAVFKITDKLNNYPANKSVAQKNYKEVTHTKISTAVLNSVAFYKSTQHLFFTFIKVEYNVL